MNGIPFTLDRAQRATLIDQMTDGLRRAILSGFYRPGDKLPKVRDLVAHFGVSNRVPLAAVKRLATEGLIDASPRTGCTVRPKSMPVWKGHVLCIVPSGDFSYNTMILVGRLRDAIYRAGYLFTQVTVPRNEQSRLDMGLLDYFLRQPIDFAVLLDDDSALAARLSKAKLPFVCRSMKGRGLCRGTFGYDYRNAFREFAAVCCERGVKRVARVVKCAGEWAELSQTLSDAGIADEEWNLSPKRQGAGRLEILRTAAFNAISSRLAKGRDGLPDVLVFSDDYLATGAMAALCAHGVRFPEDVRVATVVNMGNAPVFRGAFDRFEIDLEVCGGLISDAVLKSISGLLVSPRIELPVRFVAEDTSAFAHT